jgi:hypothetical protein
MVKRLPAGSPVALRSMEGCVITVARLEYEKGYPFWTYEGPRLFDSAGNVAVRFMDSILRPIRDPGDDASDESFRRAPAPEKVLA